MTYSYKNYIKLTDKQKSDKILERSRNRQYFYELILQLYTYCLVNGLRLIIENPYSGIHYLIQPFGFIEKPTIIDHDRTRRGDIYTKPTAYWFVNCEPSKRFTNQQTAIAKIKTIMSAKGASRAGLCSEERSMISPDYARNFICDFILGKSQPNIDPTLFDKYE